MGIIKNILGKKVVKDFLSLTFANIAIKPLSLARGIIVAKFLGPSDYGILKSLELIQKLNKFGNLGFKQTALREVGNYYGAGDFAKAKLTRNTAYSSEIVLSVILFFIGLSSSLFFESLTISILIVLASTGLLASKISGLFGAEAVIQKQFVLMSKVTFISSIITNILVIVTVPWLKIYSVMLTNICVGVLLIYFYRRVLRFEYSFEIDRDEFKRILRISIPLTIGTLSLGAFQYSERLLLLGYLDTTALGHFGFATMIVGEFAILLKNSIKVRTQDIYEYLGRKEFLKTHKMVVKETLLFSIVALLLIPVSWYMIELLVPIILPGWKDGIMSYQIYLFVLPFHLMANYPATVLISAVVNKQKLIPIFRIIPTILLIFGVIYLHEHNTLSLLSFIYLDVSCFALYPLSILILYKIYFYNQYVKKVS